MHPMPNRDRNAIPVCVGMHPHALLGLESGRLDQLRLGSRIGQRCVGGCVGYRPEAARRALRRARLPRLERSGRCAHRSAAGFRPPAPTSPSARRSPDSTGRRCIASARHSASWRGRSRSPARRGPSPAPSRPTGSAALIRYRTWSRRPSHLTGSARAIKVSRAGGGARSSAPVASGDRAVPRSTRRAPWVAAASKSISDHRARRARRAACGWAAKSAGRASAARSPRGHATVEQPLELLLAWRRQTRPARGVRRPSPRNGLRSMYSSSFTARLNSVTTRGDVGGSRRHALPTCAPPPCASARHQPASGAPKSVMNRRSAVLA